MPDIDAQMITIPARVRVADHQPQAAAQAQQRAGDPGLPDEVIFVFEAEISNSELDAYFTHMAPSSLQNYAQAAARGVAMLDSHDGGKLPVAYSMAGQFRQDGDRAYVVATFYTRHGIRFGGQHSFATTDDLIAAIQAGLVRDVSIGFYGGQHVCDICGRDYYGLWHDPNATEYCPHIAGVSYDVPAGEGIKRQTICTLTVENASLAEVSLVFDGATPGAVITKAEALARNGQIDPVVAEAIELRYRVKLPRAENGVNQMKKDRNAEAAQAAAQVDAQALAEGTQADGGQVDVDAQAVADGDQVDVDAQAQAGGAQADGGPLGVAEGQPDDQPEAERQAAKVIAEAQQVLARVAGLADGDLIARLQSLADMAQRLAGELDTERLAHQQAAAQVTELAPLAEDGRAYRADLIEATIADGIRAQGATFPVDVYERLLAGSDLAAIKAIRASFQAVATDRLPAGRQTNTKPAQAPAPVADVDAVPDMAYAA